MFKIHNPNYLSSLPVQQIEDLEPRRVRFQAGRLQDLRRLSEEEWEESKKKALRWQPGWQPEGR